MPFSMMKAVMPCAPASGWVLAYTIRVEATVPFVIHILLPLSKNPPSGCLSARQRMLTTSDPALGSDMARAPTCSPAGRGAVPRHVG
jgi:hypothetical protein